MPDNRSPQLDHERLDVYRAALQFVQVLPTLVPRPAERALREQLERASSSIVLNIAEGAGRHSSPDKQRFYEIAKGSATECAAILDVLRTRGIGAAAEHVEARGLIVRVVQMLSRLCGPPGRNRSK